MAFDHDTARYRVLYARLLRFYPKSYGERFGEGMEQTFNDLLRERRDAKRGLFGFALWMFVETSVGILREYWASMTTYNKNITRIALATVCILLIPLVAMQFTDEVNWGVGDFMVMGALLFGSGLTFELIARRGSTMAYRAAVGVAVAAALLLVWINFAVGIIGREDNPANVMYLGVLFTGLIGATIARLRPRGMARVLYAMALAQALVPVIALFIWRPSFAEPPGLVGVLFLNAFFVTLFVVSALLFRQAGATDPT